MTLNAPDERVVIIVTFSEIMALKRRGARRRTEVELSLFFFLARTLLIMVVLFPSWAGGVRSWQWIFKYLEWGKVSGYARANASVGT